MGLTIHYGLTTDLTKPSDIRQLVEAVRQFALDLPFESVSEIIEFSGDDLCPVGETARWLRIQPEAHVEVEGRHYRCLRNTASPFQLGTAGAVSLPTSSSASIRLTSASTANESSRSSRAGLGRVSAKRSTPATQTD